MFKGGSFSAVARQHWTRPCGMPKAFKRLLNKTTQDDMSGLNPSRISFLAISVGLFGLAWQSAAFAQVSLGQTAPVVTPTSQAPAVSEVPPTAPAKLSDKAAPPAAPVIFASSTQQGAPDALGDTVVLEGDSVTREPGSENILAEGNVVARYQGRTLKADRLAYDQTTKIIKASGNVAIVEADGSVSFANEITLDDKFETGVVSNYGARLPSNATLAAASATRQAASRNSLNLVLYTACKVCEDKKVAPTWVIRARNATQDQQSQMIEYRDVVFEVKGVPILYFPYFAHPDPTSKRRAGFLQPTPGRSSKRGVFYEQPYLWLLGPSTDLVTSVQLNEKVAPLLDLDFRREFHSGRLNLRGSGTYEKLFDSQGNRFGPTEWRGHIFGDGKFDISKNWLWGFGAEYVTDDLYLRRYERTGEGLDRGTFRAQPGRLLNQIYAIGQSENYFIRSAALSFQGLRGLDEDRRFPKVAPLVEGTYIFKTGPMNGRLALNADALQLVRTTGTDTRRLTAGASWNGQTIIGNGVVVEPFAQARSDYYDVKNRAGARDVSFNRTVGLAGIEARWPLIRPGPVTVLIEPRIMAGLGTKDGNDKRIPVEEGLGFELDATSLFRPAGAAGLDLWEGGARIAAGVKMSALWGSNEASLLVGQRWRSEADKAFPISTNLGSKTGDFLVDGELKLASWASAGVRARFDAGTGEIARMEARGSLRYWRFDVAARYYDKPASTSGTPANRELQSTVGFRIDQSWRAFYNNYRDLRSNTNLLQQTGLEYYDDCTVFRVYYQRSETRDRFIGPSDAIKFEVALTTLGTLSRDSFARTNR